MDNGTSQIVDYEGVLWMGLHFGLAWASYAQWIMIFIMDFIRIGLRKLQLTELGAHQIGDDAKSLAKIPSHLAVITEDDACLRDLANVVVWTILLGVSCVTIHCKNGMKPNIFNEFVTACERRKAEMKSVLKINFFNECRFQTSSAGSNVSVSSVAWGRHKIITAAQTLCKQVQAGEIRVSDLNMELVNKTLRDEAPEPDLAICFSPYPSLHGFDPWDTRLTEIITVGSSKNICYPQFLNILKQYAKTKQRFGK